MRQRTKKQNSGHIRYTDPVLRRILESIAENNSDITQELELLIVDGWAARDYLSPSVLKDNRKKYL